MHLTILIANPVTGFQVPRNKSQCPNKAGAIDTAYRSITTCRYKNLGEWCLTNRYLGHYLQFSKIGAIKLP